MELHDLTPAYALDALDPAEARAFERHLATCERCRDELAKLQDAAGALAFATDAPPPPPHLRERILERARGERSNVIPLRRNRPFQWAAGAATAAAAAAVALGVWGASVDRDLDSERSANAEVAAILSDAAREAPVRGATGTLVVARSGRAVLALDDLPRVPEGKRYHLWVISDGEPQPAGLFDEPGVHVLERAVPPGATVAVTAEDGPRTAPTSPPVLTARA